MRLAGLALVASVMVGCSSSSPVSPAPSPTTTLTAETVDAVIQELADNGGKAVVSYLTAAPVTGDQTGTLKMSSNAGQNELCYALRYTGSISRPTSVRMYKGSDAGTGAEVITFAVGAPLYACDSTSFTREFLRDVGRYPADYSVQVSVDASLVLQGRFEPLKQPYK